MFQNINKRIFDSKNHRILNMIQNSYFYFYWINLWDVRGGTTHLRTETERSIVLTSIRRVDDVEATLQCHAHVNRSVHWDTAVTSTIPGLILPLLSWALGRIMVISYSRPILPQTMFTKAQRAMEEHMVRAPLRPHQPVRLYTGGVPNQTIFIVIFVYISHLISSYCFFRWFFFSSLLRWNVV